MEADITEGSARISVVIPAFNAGNTLPRCLDSIAAQSVPPLEVVLVDDGSTDSTAAIAIAAGVRVIRCPCNTGPAAARNLGVNTAEGDVILFLDSDVVIPPDLVGRIRETLERQPEVAAVQTVYSPDCPALNTVSRYQNLYYHCSLTAVKLDRVATFATWCAAVRKNDFLKVGGFNTSIPEPTVEDEEFGYAMADSGRTILLDRRLQGTHLASYDIRHFVSRRYRMAVAQAKSGWRSIRERLLKRYINIRETGTHHSRGVVLSILLTLAGIAGLASSPFTGSAFGTAAAASLALLALALLGHVRLLAAATRTYGLRSVPSFAVLCLMDMAVLGAGIVSGTLQYIAGRKY
jgi:glycosyltransferase involved in cell wall biosynthesis